MPTAICRRVSENLRRTADHGGGPGCFRHDARLSALRPGRPPVGRFPHLAQHHHPDCRRGADPAVPLQHSPAVERAHLYQAILNGESHVRNIDFLTTLAGYVHWQLTGEKVLGIGDASGIFPIDSAACDYDAAMMASFDELLAGAGMPYRLQDLLPRVLCAGQDAGSLTETGAHLLDPTVRCPPACRSVRPREMPGPVWLPPIRWRCVPAM